MTFLVCIFSLYRFPLLFLTYFSTNLISLYSLGGVFKFCGARTLKLFNLWKKKMIWILDINCRKFGFEVVFRHRATKQARYIFICDFHRHCRPVYPSLPIHFVRNSYFYDNQSQQTNWRHSAIRTTSNITISF